MTCVRAPYYYLGDCRLIDGVGLWFERLGGVKQLGLPALFLDRDGVIVEESHYLGRPQDVRMIKGAAAAIRSVNEEGLPVVVVTNQAGIGRGHYDWIGFEAVQREIITRLADEGAKIDLVIACAFHENGLGKFAVPDHPWRKPRPGMFNAAAKELGIDLSQSMIVGDKISDLEAGMRAGVGRGSLVETGHGAAERSRLVTAVLAPMKVTVAANVAAALQAAHFLRPA